MKTVKRWIFALCAAVAALCCGLNANAQADAQFTQFYNVPTYYNAGAVGSTEWLRLRGGARLQWAGIENAPLSFVVAGDTPYKLFGKNIGLGVVALQESLGLYRNLQANAQVAYKMKLLGGTLSIGLQVGMVNEGFKGSEVNIPDDDDFHDGNDEAIPKNDVNGTAFDMGVGLWYSQKHWYVGLSCQHLLQPNIKLNGGSGGTSTGTEGTYNYEFQVGRMLYLTAGGNIEIKNTLFEVMPAVLINTDTKFFNGEGHVRLRYRKFLSAGVGYRYKDAVTISLGAEFKNFLIGYSFDYSTTAIAKASSGSHEIFLGYNTKIDLSQKNKNRHKSIRIM